MGQGDCFFPLHKEKEEEEEEEEEDGIRTAMQSYASMWAKEFVSSK